MAGLRGAVVLRVLVLPALGAAAVLLWLLFGRAGGDPEWHVGLLRSPPGEHAQQPGGPQQSGAAGAAGGRPRPQCVQVWTGVPTSGSGAIGDCCSSGWYQQQAWQLQGGREVWYRPDSDKWKALAEEKTAGQERFLFRAGDGGWVITGERRDLETDAGYYRSYSNDRVPLRKVEQWWWGDGREWRKAPAFRVSDPAPCPPDLQGGEVGPPTPEPPPTPAPTYLALFETYNATRGELPRDRPGGGTAGVMRWRMLSAAKPRVLYVENFSDDEDCAEVLGYAQNSLVRSGVVAQSPADQVNDVRTSSGMFLSPAQMATPRVDAMRRRVARIAQLPVENIEGTQVLRYRPGEQYFGHPDYFQAEFTNHLARGGQRVATALTWLNDVRRGGYTDFPMRRELSIRPKKGDLLLFYDTDKFGNPDPYSEHAGRPPNEGSVKWVQVFWIRQRRFT